MKRCVLLSLLFLIGLVAPAHASTLIRPLGSGSPGSCITNHTIAGSPQTSLTINVSPNLDGDAMLLCALNDGGGALTFPAGFLAMSGTGLPTGGAEKLNCALKTASSEGATYVVSGLSGNWRAVVCSVMSTDKSTPVLDVDAGAFNNSTSSLAAATVSTSQANDLVVFVEMGDQFPTAPTPLGTIFTTADVSVKNGAVGYVGQPLSGTSIAPTFTSGGNSMNIATVAFKSNTTTAGLFVGVGPEQFNAGGANTVSPAFPSNTANGNTDIATILQSGSLTTVIPSSDGQFRPSTGVQVQNLSGGTQAITVSSNDLSGDFLLLFARCPANQTLTSVPSGWTFVTSQVPVGAPGSGYVYRAVATGSNAPGSSISWTCSGASSIVLGMSGWYSVSGTTITVDASSMVTSASASTANTPSITTTVANDLIVPMAYLDLGTGAAVPSNLQTAYATVWLSQGYVPQTAVGSSAQYTFTANSGSAAWLVGAVALRAGPAPWTQISSTITDPGSTIRLDVFTHQKTSTDPSSYKFYFPSQPSSSAAIISDWVNLNTTTPSDTCTSLATAGMNTPMGPSMTPTPADELLSYALSPSVSLATPIFTLSGSVNHIGLGYGPLSGAAAQSAGGNSNTNPFVTLKCGLKAASTPTRTTAHALVNLEALEVFTSTLPFPFPGSWPMP